MGFSDSSVGRESACNAGDTGSVPGSGRSAGEGIGYSFQYSGLENSLDCLCGPKELDTTERLYFTFNGRQRLAGTEGRKAH